MMRSKTFLLGAAFAATFALGLSVEPNVALWSGSGGYFTSARAQLTFDACTEVPIPGAADGAEYYTCPNGEYYRDIDGEFVQVDEQGNAIAEPNGAEAEAGTAPGANATPEADATPEAEATPEAGATPEAEAAPEGDDAATEPEAAGAPVFKKVPKSNGSQPRANFKKVPG